MARKVCFKVELEQGDTWEAWVDQRDIAAWELQEFYDDNRTTVRMRYTAYAASVRSGQTSLSWPKFNAACVGVTFAGSEGDDDPVPPTVPDPSGES